MTDDNLKCAVRLWCDAEFGELEDDDCGDHGLQLPNDYDIRDYDVRERRSHHWDSYDPESNNDDAVTHDDDDYGSGTQAEIISGLCEGTGIDVYSESIKVCGKANTWDTSAIKTMKGLFKDHINCNLEINGWQVASVTDASYMFLNAAMAKFNQALNSWQTGKVTSMRSMFESAAEFDQTLDSWRTGSAVDFRDTFSNALKFNQPLDLWQTEMARRFDGMFENACAFNQNIDSWQTENAKDTHLMFASATYACHPDYDTPAGSFNQPLDSWQTSLVTEMYRMFGSQSKFNQPLNSWQTENVEYMQYMFQDAASFNQNIDSWQLGSVVQAYYTFKGAGCDCEVPYTNVPPNYKYDPTGMFSIYINAAGGSNCFATCGSADVARAVCEYDCDSSECDLTCN